MISTAVAAVRPSSVDGPAAGVVGGVVVQPALEPLVEVDWLVLPPLPPLHSHQHPLVVGELPPGQEA